MQERLDAGALWQDLDLVFATYEGRPLQATHMLTGSFRRVREAAGIGPMRFHGPQALGRDAPARPGRAAARRDGAARALAESSSSKRATRGRVRTGANDPTRPFKEEVMGKTMSSGSP